MGCRYVVVGESTVTKYGCPTDKYTAGQNLAEAATWERVRDTDVGRMFAPVLSCEPDGSKLVMMRATPLEPTDTGRMNAFYDMLAMHNYHEPDPQTDNVGDLRGRTVAIDYGYRDMSKQGVRGGTCSKCIACKNYGKVER